MSEQVSHHPPITAVYMWDDENGIRGEGYSRVAMTFSGSIDIRQMGHAVLHIDKYDEDHLIFLPDCTVRGFMTGVLFPELHGTYHIVSSSGFVSEITFSGASLLGSSGKRNSVKAIVYRRGDTSKTPLYIISGCWSGCFEVRQGGTGEVMDIWDPNDPRNSISEAQVEPVENQDCWESRKAWNGVITALQGGHFGQAVTEKSKIENAQRELRAQRDKKSEAWQPRLFSALPGSYGVFDRLGSAVGWDLQADKTNGVWKVNRDSVQTLNRPFHSIGCPWKGFCCPLLEAASST